MTNEQLVIRIQAGENTADHMLQLYNQMKKAIYKIASQYAGIAEMDDLLQEGYIALCGAVGHYDSSRRVSFFYYAWKYITWHLQRYMHGIYPIHIPEGMCVLLERYRKLCRTFLLEQNRRPSEAEIAYYLGVSKEKTSQLLKTVKIEHIGSLDIPIGEEGELTVGDSIAGEESTDQGVLDRVQQEQLNRELWECVDSLPGNQPEIIRKRFQEGMTLKAVGEIQGRSIQAISNAEKKALRILGGPSYRDRLLPMYDDGLYSDAMRGCGVGRFNRTWTSSTERIALELLSV